MKRHQEWKSMKFHWQTADSYVGLAPITQVYGVCFTANGKILILNISGFRWNIPGGRPESGETPEQTLKREVMEETTVSLKLCTFLGYQKVWQEEAPGIEPFYQLRYVALIDRVHAPTPDPDTQTIHERDFVTPEEFLKRIPFPEYRSMLERALEWYRSVT